MNANLTKILSWKSVLLLFIGAGLLVATVFVLVGPWVRTIQVLSAETQKATEIKRQAAEVITPPMVGGGFSFKAPSQPVRLRIGAIGVDAAIQSVGLLKNGSMGIPTNFTDVAWYNQGSLPGMFGSAVIAGHLDGKNTPEAVFYNLGSLEIGDMVEVVDQEESVHQFRVVDVKTYDYNASTTEVFSGDSSKARLNLITCGGSWIKSQKLYDKRIVIFTELVTEG